MNKSLFTTIFLLIIYGCSPEEDTVPPTNTVQKAIPDAETVVTQHTLTVTAGFGGTVSSEGGTYDYGKEVSITAIPNEGYEFLGWEGIDSSENSLIINIEVNQTLNALFQIIIVQYTLVVSAGEGGRVSNEGGTYDYGTEVNIKATPNEGFEFVGWEGYESDKSSLNLLMDSNITLKAKFENLSLLNLDVIQNKILDHCTFSSKYDDYTFYSDLNQVFLDRRIIIFSLNNYDLSVWLDSSNYLLFYYNDDNNLNLIQVYKNSSLIQSFNINGDEISKLDLLIQFLDSDSLFSQTRSLEENNFQIEDGIYLFTDYEKRISNNDSNERFKCKSFGKSSTFNHLQEKGKEYFKVLNGEVAGRVLIFPSDFSKSNIVWSFNDWYYTDAYTNKVRAIISVNNCEIDNYSKLSLDLQNSILLIEDNQINGFKAAKILNKVTTQDIGTNLIESYKGIGFYADKIYSNIDFDDPNTYLSAFIQDAARNNIDLSYIDIDVFEFTIIPDNEWTGSSSAFASRSCFDSQINITFKESVWEEGKVPFKTSIPDAVKIMWHELGHDILNLDHVCLGDHIMSGRHQEPKIVYSTADCEEEYITLYGMDWDNLDPRKNFQRAVIDMFAGTEQIYINCSTSKGGVYY